MSALPATVREVRLVDYPTGLPTPEHLAVVEVPMPVPGPGEVLVRNRWFRVFASMRMVIGGAVEGTPYPVLRPGDALAGAAIGEVVRAPADSALRPGDLVEHWLGWREYAVLSATECVPLGDVLPDPIAHLSQGWTAYAALTRGLRIRPGDTVFVAGAAGAIGSMAGQLARLLGAGRVIGSTGSRAKADRLVAELGYDAAVVRGAGPIADQLAEAAPEGIDVLFDNVGGEQLRAAVTAARPAARFVLIGALSGQLAEHGAGTSAMVELDSFQLVLKRLELRGFSADDVEDAATRAEWLDRFGGWLRSGAIRFPHVRLTGIDQAPRALPDVIAGRHLGTVLVEL
ncbi:MDR family NADP-dependent oxidoreductase [Embleya sp. AB8]|uniref:MDR family NADP-dependent oxidoreductase n=1 Tax=Embleya sp. AB8 TaxID=3156304 RepID=UPI003C790478